MPTKKVFPKRFLLFYLLLMVKVFTHAQTTLPEENMPWINFQWQDEVLDGRKLEKIAMLIPLEINNIPFSFHAQFDLGAVSTMLYENTLKPYLNLAPGIPEKIDTNKTIFIQGVPCPVISGLDISLDKIDFPNRDIALLKNYGDVMTEDSTHTSTVKHIGTIAADLFTDKILIIDYPNQRLCGVSVLPESWQKRTDFTDIEYLEDNGWIFLPLQIDGVTKKVIFDTGSSLFPLISSAEKIAQIADTTKCVDTLTATSWGETEKVYGFMPTVEIKLGKTLLNPLPVYYSEEFDDEMFDEAGFWGLAGNRYFLDKTIVIDYKNERFGIIQ